MDSYLTGGAQPESMYQTMSITSPGRPTLFDQKKIPGRFEEKRINFISDIEGSSTRDKFEKYATRPQFDAGKFLPESKSVARTHVRNVPDNALMIDDIDGAQYAALGGMDRTNRRVNPLNPKYNLPTYKVPVSEYDAPLAVKSRDIMGISDIDGAAPSANRRTQKFMSRDTMNISDIDGAAADYHGFKAARERFEEKLQGKRQLSGAIPALAPPPFQQVLPKFQDRTTRSTNLCAPVYNINGIVIEDDPRFCKPKAERNFVQGGTFSLFTSDIPGAMSTNNPRKKERREIRNIMNTQDVLGAQADTVVHSIVSNRNTNPLFPVFQSLDDGAPMSHEVAPLIPASRVQDPSVRLLKMRSELKASMQVQVETASKGATPINSARSGFYSPVKDNGATGGGSSRGASNYNTPLNSGRGVMNTMGSSKSVPVLDTSKLNTGGLSARSGGTGRGSQAAQSRREEILSVRDLPQ